MLNPITAVTAADPYPYYAELVKNKPFYYDRKLAMWIASGFEMVELIFKNPVCRVRPAAEPVLQFLRETAAGEIFRHLVRMTDGKGHCPLKMAVTKTLDEIDLSEISNESARQADFLFDELRTGKNFEWLTEYAFRLPIYTLGGLLGFSRDNMRKTEMRLRAFVRCLAPGSSAEQITAGIEAASPLIDIFERAASATAENISSNLIASLAEAGIYRRELAIYNLIGLFFQAYEATAGIFGNSLVTLGTRPAQLEKIKNDPDSLNAFLMEVERFDPPVQNTRRFVDFDLMIAGRQIKAGETILLVTAAANRDPAANRHPDIFNPERKNIRSLTFGAGAHRCPGRNLAFSIAAASLRKLIFSNAGLNLTGKSFSYRDSANTRIPLFKGEI